VSEIQITTEDIDNFDRLRNEDFGRQLTPEESSEFLKGSSQAMLGPSRTKDGHLAETTATRLYLFTMLYWHWIFDLPSVTAFHEQVVRALGRNIVGDKKRVEQFCHRIGLRFRGRGRPPWVVCPPRPR